MDEDEKVRGIVDAIRIEAGKIIVVEVKSSHGPTLGHALQTMMYTRMVHKAVESLGKKVEAYLVYRHGVRSVKVKTRLLAVYRRRAEASISHSLPPPPPPKQRYCEQCPWRVKCSEMPRMD